MSDLKVRLVTFAREQYNMGQNKFEEYCGISRGIINAIKGSGISTNTLTKIIVKCPDLNVRWLLLGEGDMRITEMTPKESVRREALGEVHMNSPDKDTMCELQLLRLEKELRDKYDAVIAEKDEQIYKLTSMLEYAQKRDVTDAGCADVKHVG